MVDHRIFPRQNGGARTLRVETKGNPQLAASPCCCQLRENRGLGLSTAASPRAPIAGANGSVTSHRPGLRVDLGSSGNAKGRPKAAHVNKPQTPESGFAPRIHASSHSASPHKQRSAPLQRRRVNKLSNGRRLLSSGILGTSRPLLGSRSPPVPFGALAATESVEICRFVPL